MTAIDDLTSDETRAKELEQLALEASAALGNFVFAKGEKERILRDRALTEVLPVFEVYKARRKTVLQTFKDASSCYTAQLAELKQRIPVYEKRLLDEAYLYAIAKADFDRAMDKSGDVLSYKDAEFIL